MCLTILRHCEVKGSRITFLKNCFLLRSDASRSIKELYKLTGLVESATLYKFMELKQINISEEKVSQVTEILEQEYKNLFGIHINKKN